MTLNMKNIRERMKVLPVGDPMVTTYTQHAHLLSILTQYEYTHPWIYSNYIQLFINRDFKHNWGDFYFPSAYETRPSDTCKWVISQKIHRDTVKNRRSSILNFFIESINLDNYAHTMLNYYYVPFEEHFKKVHFQHDIFIYGYDMDKEIFYVSDFFRNGIYRKEEISFSDFCKAFSAYNLTNPLDDYLNGMIYLYKFNENYKHKYKFSMGAVVNSINRYIDCSVPEYWDIYNYESDGNNIAYGMEIYSTLKNYSMDVVNSESKLFDIKPFYLLYDHKRIMNLRLRYLYNQGYIDKLFEEDINKYSAVEVQAKDVLNLVVIYDIYKGRNIIYKDADYVLNKIFEGLNTIETEEFNTLSKLFKNRRYDEFDLTSKQDRQNG